LLNNWFSKHGVKLGNILLSARCSGYSWHEDVCFSRANQPLETEAASADAAAISKLTPSMANAVQHGILRRSAMYYGSAQRYTSKGSS